MGGVVKLLGRLSRQENALFHGQNCRFFIMAVNLKLTFWRIKYVKLQEIVVEGSKTEESKTEGSRIEVSERDASKKKA